MTQNNEIYKCELCGNLIEVLLEGAGELVCCGEPMILVEEKLSDAGLSEKHIPVFETNLDGSSVVKIGSIEHPMNKEHHIEFIEIISTDGICRKKLKLDDKPELTISCKDVKYAREYCNLHGLWKGTKK